MENDRNLGPNAHHHDFYNQKHNSIPFYVHVALTSIIHRFKSHAFRGLLTEIIYNYLPLQVQRGLALHDFRKVVKPVEKKKPTPLMFAWCLATGLIMILATNLLTFFAMSCLELTKLFMICFYWPLWTELSECLTVPFVWKPAISSQMRWVFWSRRENRGGSGFSGEWGQSERANLGRGIEIGERDGPLPAWSAEAFRRYNN